MTISSLTPEDVVILREIITEKGRDIVSLQGKLGLQTARAESLQGRLVAAQRRIRSLEEVIERIADFSPAQ